MDRLEITNERINPESLKRIDYLTNQAQAYYYEGKISIIGGFEGVCFENIIRMMVHESHHYVLHKLFNRTTTEKLNNIEDLDNLLYDDMNLNFERVKR